MAAQRELLPRARDQGADAVTTWGAIEDALFDFIVAATGLAPGQVTKSEQDGNAPSSAGAAVTFALGDVLSKGVDGVETSAVDETAKTITREATGAKELMVTFRGYSALANGDESARALLSKLQLAAANETNRDLLNAAGLGILDVGDVQALPRIENSGWQGNAVLEWRTCVLQTASEVVPYIAHADGTGTVHVPGGADKTWPIKADLT